MTLVVHCMKIELQGCPGHGHLASLHIHLLLNIRGVPFVQRFLRVSIFLFLLSPGDTCCELGDFFVYENDDAVRGRIRPCSHELRTLCHQSPNLLL